MAAPNIVGVATITGVTTAYSHIVNTPITLVSNSAGSNRVIKINHITLANVSATTVGLCTIKHHFNTGTFGAAPGAGTSVSIINQVGVSTGTSLVAIDRASAFYLQEAESLSVQANVANVIETFVSYEIIQ